MTPAIRVKDRDGLLSVIPVVLGYHPTDSVVLACVTEDTGHMEPVVRCDLSYYIADAKALADQIVPTVLRHADCCFLVFYGLDADPRHFDKLLRIRGLPVVDTVFTDNEPHALNLELQAEHVLHGKRVPQ